MKIKNNRSRIWKTRIENENKKKKELKNRKGKEKQRGGRHAIKVDDLKCHLYILNQFPLFASNVGQHASSVKKDMLVSANSRTMIWRVPERMETELTPTAAIVRVQYALRLKVRKHKWNDRWKVNNREREWWKESNIIIFILYKNNHFRYKYRSLQRAP